MSEAPFREEFPHTYGCLFGLLKWASFYAVGIALAVFFPVMMFGFALGFICASLLAAWEIGSRKAKVSTDTALTENRKGAE